MAIKRSPLETHPPTCSYVPPRNAPETILIAFATEPRPMCSTSFESKWYSFQWLPLQTPGVNWMIATPHHKHST
jgi:hypothetical protein